MAIITGDFSSTGAANRDASTHIQRAPIVPRGIISRPIIGTRIVSGAIIAWSRDRDRDRRERETRLRFADRQKSPDEYPTRTREELS
jgi:hypothetical protein